MSIFSSVKCCSLGNEHVVESPTCLVCDHVVCKACMNGQDDIFCSICNKICLVAKAKPNENKKTQELIEIHLDKLFDIIKEKFQDLLKEFDVKRLNYEQSIINRFDFIKEEVDVLVDSLKTELETLSDILKNEIEERKQEYLNYKLSTLNFNEKYADFTQILEKFKQEHERTQEKLYLFQNELKTLDKYFRTYFKNDYTISLDNELVIKSLGRINIRNDIKYQLKTQKYELITIDEDLIGICNIRDEYLIACDASTGRLFMYDSKFNKINQLNQLNGNRIYAYYVVTDGNDRVYITSQCEHKLIMTNSKLEFIKYANKDVIKRCYGIYYYQNYVYICDYEGTKVVKFNADLVDFIDYQLDINPTQIQIFGQTACVRGWDKQTRSNNSIDFYDLNTFQLKQRIGSIQGDIFAYDHLLYHHNFHVNRFDIYNENGIKIDEIATDGFSKSIPDNGWRGICLFNGKFVHTTSNFSRRLILI